MDAAWAAGSFCRARGPLDELVKKAEGLALDKSLGGRDLDREFVATPFLQDKARGVVKEFMQNVPKKCAHCNAFSPRVRRDGPQKLRTSFMLSPASKTQMFLDPLPRSQLGVNANLGLGAPQALPPSEAPPPTPPDKPRLMYPNEARAHLKLLYKNETKLLGQLFPLRSPGNGSPGLGNEKNEGGVSSDSPNLEDQIIPQIHQIAQATNTSSKPGGLRDGYGRFFLQTLMVPPNKFRPPQMLA
eukprot:1387613-Amorphochlora_amoeboformis.AAC.1